jgi:hypothetical protein
MSMHLGLPTGDFAKLKPEPLRRSLSSADCLVLSAGLRAHAADWSADWDACFEEDYQREVSLVMLHQRCDLRPSFLLCREDALLTLTSCDGDQHSLEGVFTSAGHAFEALRRLLVAAGAATTTR